MEKKSSLETTEKKLKIGHKIWRAGGRKVSKERKMTDVKVRQREISNIIGVLKNNPKSGREQRFQDIIKKILGKKGF